MSKFTAEQITDQKRLVRGEHWLCARRLLRVRDEVHHAAWRVLILAGGSPQEEIHVIRHLLPRAFIVAIDKDMECVSLARDAGADVAIRCDLTDYTYTDGGSKRPCQSLQEFEPFDVMHLDLCAGPTRQTREIFSAYRDSLSAGSVFIGTFSYGRDVVESQQQRLYNLRRYPLGGFERLMASGVPEHIAGRIVTLFSPSALLGLVSTMTYTGNQMPMCSVLLAKTQNQSILPPVPEFVSVLDTDLENALIGHEQLDPALLYATPASRILALRRHFAAIKAVLTRQSRARESALP